MKLLTLSLTAFSLLGGLGSCAGQDIPQKDVPSVVLNAASDAYPTATGMEWEKERGNYEAEFRVGAAEYKALITPSGTVLQAKHDITVAALPQAVQDAIARHHQNFHIEDAELLEKGEAQYYQVELESGNRERKLVADLNGQEQPQSTYWD